MLDPCRPGRVPAGTRLNGFPNLGPTRMTRFISRGIKVKPHRWTLLMAKAEFPSFLTKILNLSKSSDTVKQRSCWVQLLCLSCLLWDINELHASSIRLKLFMFQFTIEIQTAPKPSATSILSTFDPKVKMFCSVWHIQVNSPTAMDVLRLCHLFFSI